MNFCWSHTLALGMFVERDVHVGFWIWVKVVLDKPGHPSCPETVFLELIEFIASFRRSVCHSLIGSGFLGFLIVGDNFHNIGWKTCRFSHCN